MPLFEIFQIGPTSDEQQGPKLNFSEIASRPRSEKYGTNVSFLGKPDPALPFQLFQRDPAT
ncbi:MAG: hypothetical protein GY820_17795, partial [Gammaproteobacteria bacterium]|nr:hypothetical protein [Gammaproteobacteria bacterium]